MEIDASSSISRSPSPVAFQDLISQNQTKKEIKRAEIDYTSSKSPQLKTRGLNKKMNKNQETIENTQQLRKLPPLPKTNQQYCKLIGEREIELSNIENSLKNNDYKSVPSQNNFNVIEHKKLKKKISLSKEGSRFCKQNASLGDDDSDESEKWF